MATSCCVRAVHVHEMVASEARERRRREPSRRAKRTSQTEQKAWEIFSKEGRRRAPRCMRDVLIFHVVASETSERALSLRCQRVKLQSNTRASEIQSLSGGRLHQRQAKLIESRLTRGLKHAFRTPAHKTSPNASLAITSATSRRATLHESTRSCVFSEKPWSAHPAHIEVLENVTPEQN